VSWRSSILPRYSIYLPYSYILAFLYSPNTLNSSAIISNRAFALWKCLYFSKVTSTKNEYFQGISITGRDCILVRLRLQSLITFRIAAKLPLLWSVKKRTDALLISSSGQTLFCVFTIINRVEFSFTVCMLLCIISNP